MEEMIRIPVRLTLLETALLVEVAPDSGHGLSTLIPLPVLILEAERAARGSETTP